MSDLLEGQVELDPTLDFIAGTVAGMASLTVGFPFDTVKVRFQNPTTAAKYHSTLHAVATIVREEKFIGLYKGITSPLATVALMNGLVFASYRFFMKIQLEHSQAIPTLAQITLAGAGSGIVSSIITTPTELIKIRQQSSLIPTSTHAVALQIFREAGLGGLYRGITATALRDCGYGAYFLAYEATLRYFASRPTEASPRPTGQNGPSWPALLIAGGLAGIFGWLATFPLDVVKTRMQGTARAPVSRTPGTASPTSNPTTPLLAKPGQPPDANPYQSTMSTIIHSYRTEGISVFFRGLAPTLIRAIPVNMVTFATFEAIVHGFS
ncbi:Mitochondrial basic amino acids transporter [Hypsizygus marmoreus]|uniref:Mitochondrial basic amino acids transporter n=1 Tax=Hypsizygus marmoreus TaxID=39966 RepID=A0A369JDS8_HYPMA|nr:Mitochondrial basic amino acids transporter [Hypsizygus marmoreus]